MSDKHFENFREFAQKADSLIDPSKVRLALDVGSRDAEVAIYLKNHYPNAVVYAFECNPPAVELCRRALNGRHDIFLVDRAVSDVNGSLDFYAIDPEKTVTPHDDGNIGASSLYKANSDYPYEKYMQRKISVESVTLETWAFQNVIKAIDVLWIDLQGAELKAFRGLGTLINTVQIIHTEVEYKEMYLGQPLAKEVQDFLTSKGFVLHTRYNTSDWFGDELYCRKGLLPWWSRVRHGVRRWF
jgi:FkbM family methyltransferase